MGGFCCPSGSLGVGNGVSIVSQQRARDFCHGGSLGRRNVGVGEIPQQRAMDFRLGSRWRLAGRTSADTPVGLVPKRLSGLPAPAAGKGLSPKRLTGNEERCEHRFPAAGRGLPSWGTVNHELLSEE